MAEDITPTPSPDPAGPTPAIDPEALKQLVSTAVREHLAANSSSVDDVNLEQPVQPRATINPLEAVIRPIIDPMLRTVGIAAASAEDLSLFYATTPEALKYRDKIEEAFKSLVDQGTPFKRQAVWEWYRGKKENFDKFVKEAREQEELVLAGAKNAQDLGGGNRPLSGSFKNAREATDEELNKGLENVTF